jgi:hypothetical protein
VLHVRDEGGQVEPAVVGVQRGQGRGGGRAEDPEIDEDARQCAGAN